MSNWQNVTFNIPRQSDHLILNGALKSFNEAGVQLDEITLLPVVGGDVITGSADAIQKNKEVQKILQANTQMIRRFAFLFAGKQLNLQVNRPDDQLRDTVQINITPLNSANTRLIGRDELLRLSILSKQYLKEISGKDQLEIFGSQVREHYEVREANLARLESALSQIMEQFGKNAAQQRKDFEDEFRLRRESLEKEFGELKKQVAAQAEERETQLREREEQLEKRLAEIDDREARHARRKLREDLKQELKSRSQKFELTQGTRKMRSPIFWFSIILLIIFGGGFIAYSAEAFREMAAGNVATPQLIAISIRQATFAIVFGSTAVFFIRWNDRWFEQHAAEEFKLKRLELDLDRASWVAEMAREWKEEKGTEIPAELLDRLTMNLFSEGKTEEGPLHPVDQLASALLGSSAAAKVDLPGGGSLTLDRKSIRDLKKQTQE